MVAPYNYELPTDRAPHYYAIACQTCPIYPEFDDLKMVDGKLQCAWCRGDSEFRRWL